MKITAKGVKWERTIGDMYVGETGYTVPWAYDPITNELDFSYSIEYAPKGTCEMKVTRTVDGYNVEIPPNSNTRYSKYPCPPKF